MAKGKKTGGKDIQPGEIKNPAGRPKTPEYLKKARKMNKIMFEAILQKYIYCTRAELITAYKAPDTPAIDLCVISVLKESATRGDQKRLEFILDRLIGKVKDVMHFEGGGGAGTVVILPSNNRSKEDEEETRVDEETAT